MLKHQFPVETKNIKEQKDERKESGTLKDKILL